MPKFDLSEVEAAEAIVLQEKAAENAAEQASRALAEEMVVGVKEARQFVDYINERVVSLRVSVSQEAVRLGKSRAKAKEDAEVAAKKMRERLASQQSRAEDYVTQCRVHEDPIVRRAVWRALIEYELTREAVTPVQLEELFAGMAASKLLVVVDDGPMVVCGKKYAVSPDSLLGDSEKAEIRNHVAKIASRVFAPNLGPEELFAGAGKDGVCFLYVPPDGLRPGGTLSLVIQNGTIRPVNVTGRIEPVVREAMKFGVVINCDDLGLDEPPLYKVGDFEKNKRSQLIWHLITRGIKYAKWSKEARATEGLISPEEWYLRSEIGVCLIETNAWKWEEVTGEGEEARTVTIWVPGADLMVERVKTDDGTAVKIFRMPSQLEEFLSECLGVYPEGEKFSGLPPRFGKLLRNGYSKTRDETNKRMKYAPSASLPNGKGRGHDESSNGMEHAVA